MRMVSYNSVKISMSFHIYLISSHNNYLKTLTTNYCLYNELIII